MLGGLTLQVTTCALAYMIAFAGKNYRVGCWCGVRMTGHTPFTLCWIRVWITAAPPIAPQPLPATSASLETAGHARAVLAAHAGV